MYNNTNKYIYNFILAFILIVFYNMYCVKVYAIDTKIKSQSATATIEKKANPTEPNSIDKSTPKLLEETYETVIKEYKEYLANLDKSVKDEIAEFRNQIRQLNEQKYTLYKKLSQSAQKHLEVERKYKQKLPIKKRKELHNLVRGS